jgi:hypothetical protein
MKKIAVLLLALVLNSSVNAFSPERIDPTLSFTNNSLAKVGEPRNTPESTVLTYIENYHAGNFEEMTSVLHEDFSNQILNQEGKLGQRQDAKDLKRLMNGQKHLAPESQKNTITLSSIENNIAQIILETGTEVARWYEYITLEKEQGKWKVKKVLWSFK